MEVDVADVAPEGDGHAVTVCYQCGHLCLGDVTYCHTCFEDRSQSDFRNEQRLHVLEAEFDSLENKLEKEQATTRRLEATVSAFRKMLLHSIHTDVTIETGDGDCTPAHRAVLASRSPVFKAMFEHELKEKTCAVIHVADVPTAAMRAVLVYLYTGEHEAKVMKEHGLAMLAAAHKYDIPDLKKVCETEVAKHVQAVNVVDTLQQARLYDAHHLKKACIESIAMNIKQVAFSEEFKNLVSRNEDPDTLLDIIQTIANTIS